MSFMVPVTMFGWLPICLVLFSMLPPRRAVLTSALAGWLFLPNARYAFGGLPDYDKSTAVGLGLLLGLLLFAKRDLRRFRASWIDIPMLVWCLVPLASSISNDLGVYDGLSAVFATTFTWGIPYLAGRVCFSDARGAKELALGILVGGLIYVPLCLYEVRMSPQLHHMVYGFHQHVFAQTKRFGGYRPTVFLQHGLAVGMWMTAATAVALWLWLGGRVRQWQGIAMSWIALALAVTTFLCKSLGSLMILAMAIGAMALARAIRTTWPLILLTLLVPGYLVARIAFRYQAESIVEFASSIDEARGDSLRGRIRADFIMVEHALDRPWFGWGGWNRFRNQRVLPDSLWAIVLGQRGMVGMISMIAAMLIPPLLLLKRVRFGGQEERESASATALAIVVVVFMIDSLTNAMPNPVFFMAAGSLAGLVSASRKPSRASDLAYARVLPAEPGRIGCEPWRST